MSRPIAVDGPTLLKSYAGGDDHAFTVLVEQQGDRLFGYLYRLCGRREMCEEVYQAVWVKVAKHADRYDGRSSFTTWLYRIARNACIDEFRKEKRHQHVSLNAPLTEDESTSALDRLISEHEEPGRDVADRELGERIDLALEGLPEEQREVFLLKEHGGLTFEEIGELLSIGKETAKSRMRYALVRLRNALGVEARAYGLREQEQ